MSASSEKEKVIGYSQQGHKKTMSFIIADNPTLGPVWLHFLPSVEVHLCISMFFWFLGPLAFDRLTGDIFKKYTILIYSYLPTVTQY